MIIISNRSPKKKQPPPGDWGMEVGETSNFETFDFRMTFRGRSGLKDRTKCTGPQKSHEKWVRRWFLWQLRCRSVMQRRDRGWRMEQGRGRRMHRLQPCATLTLQPQLQLASVRLATLYSFTRDFRFGAWTQLSLCPKSENVRDYCLRFPP